MARVPTLIVAASVACGLVACSASTAGPTSIARTSYRGAPSPAPSHDLDSPFAVRHGATLELTVYGSSSCPALPVALKVQAGATVEITLRVHGGACTADMAPTTSVIDLPTAVPAGSALTVVLRGLSGPPVTLVVPAG